MFVWVVLIVVCFCVVGLIDFFVFRLNKMVVILVYMCRLFVDGLNKRWWKFMFLCFML